MTDILWSPESLSDLQAIHTYPASGRVVPERGDPTLRELIVAPYRVVYRTREKLVEVVTVFRSSRQFPVQVL